MELRLAHPVEFSGVPPALNPGEPSTAATIETERYMKRRDLVARIAALPVLLTFVLAANGLAAGSIVEGTVRNGSGRAIAGAEVRIEARNGSNWSRRIKSDSNGFYIFDGLTPGATYRVTLVVNGMVKASINNVLAKTGATELNFGLQAKSVGGDRMVTKNGKHYVYVPAETGSHLGGRWVEVDDNGNADSVGVNNVERVGSEALRRRQSNSGSMGNMSAGGH
jgi:Carboxypeptidase regulatory-like domain